MGTIERTEETIVGTTRGVVKCRTISRLAQNERWNKDMVLGMRGVPWETIPGKRSMHIPVEISEDGREVHVEDEGNKILDNDAEGEDAGMKFRGGLDKLHISRKAVNKYGTTPGCPQRDRTTRSCARKIWIQPQPNVQATYIRQNGG